MCYNVMEGGNEKERSLVMTKTKRSISIIMVLTMLLSLCSLFTVNAFAANVNQGYAVAPTGTTRIQQTFYVTAYWGKKELTFTATAGGSSFIHGCSRNDVISYVRDYARFTISVTAPDGYTKTYFDYRIGDSITLPQKWGRKYRITVTSYYLHGGYNKDVIRSNAISSGWYMLSA